ncbi:MAG: sugar transferase [Lachnospiraceae bacterium]|nr:sugar transferase [Lachnospiraceae bacterium]
MYRKQKRSWMKHLDFTIIDLICLMVSMIGAYFLRFDGGWLFDSDDWQHLFIVMILIDVVVVFFMEPYTGILRRNRFQELRATMEHGVIIFSAILVYLYIIKQSQVYSRPTLFVFIIFSVIFEYMARVLWKRLVRFNKLQDKNKSEMLVVAEADGVEECLFEIAHNKYTDFKVMGVAVIDKDMRGQHIQGIPVVADGDSLMDFIRISVVDEVFIDGNSKNAVEQIGQELVELGITVHITLIHSNKMLPNRLMETYASYIVMTSSMRVASNRQVLIKRLMDIVGSIVGLVFTLILLIIFGPIIFFQSPGPVFYKSIRIGKNGRKFTFYKFRTMYLDADERKKELMEQNEMEGNMFKIENDPRIIPIGHFMRKYSLDEFPQFLNVLKGDMSLVGTRPPTQDEFEQYEYHHKARLGIKPGLTGMWQVSGRSDIKNFEDVVALDTEYISNWSVFLDISILLKTVGVVLTGKGSK